MPWPWLTKTTAEEQLRQDKWALMSGLRNLDQLLYRAERRRDTLIVDIKCAAKRRDKNKVASLCRSFRQNAMQIKQYNNGIFYNNSLLTQKEVTQNTFQMMKTMTHTTSALKASNKQMSGPELDKMLKDYQRTSLMIQASEEKMNDALDVVFDDSEFVGDSDDLIEQVFDELGLEELDGLVDAPRRKNAVGKRDAADNDNSELVNLLRGDKM